MARNRYNMKESHEFYCINCGNKGMDLFRETSHKHSKHHRKQLYCYHCKEIVNMIECKDILEVEEFKMNFEKGVYKDEAKNSLSYGRGTGMR